MRNTAPGTHAHTPNSPRFTPGPWRCLGHRLIVAAHGAELPVCEVLPGGVGIEQAAANERLLVAAPELFAALAEIVEGYDNDTQTGPKTIGKAREALSRCTGAAVDFEQRGCGMSAPDLIETDECFEVGRRRMDFAVDAISEIESLCGVLRKVIPPESYPENPIVRGLSARIECLANAAVAALVDTGDDIEQIARRTCIDLPKQEGR